MFFHHVPAQAELLHGFQVVEEGPFPVGESQRCRVGSFQHPGGHQARLVAHVVGLHVVGAKATAADGQVLERIDGGGKRVGGHKGHELCPVGRNDDVAGGVLRVADFLHHPGGHLGQQVIYLPTVSRVFPPECFPIGVQLFQALAAIGAGVGNADELFPAGKHPHGLGHQGGIIIACGEAAHVGTLPQSVGNHLHAGAYHGQFPQQRVVARQQRVDCYAADGHDGFRAVGAGFVADFFHHVLVYMPVAHADAQVFNVDGCAYASGFQPVRQSAVQVFVAGSGLGIGVDEGDVPQSVGCTDGQERSYYGSDGDANPS